MKKIFEKNKKSLQRLFLSLFFYGAWFACIYLAKTPYDHFSFIFPAIQFFAIFKIDGFNKKIFIASLILGLLGYLFDAFALHLGWIEIFPKPSSALIMPAWFISLWLLFASFLPLMRDLFSKRYMWAFILGFIFGPLTYLSGEKFNVLLMRDQQVIVFYAFFWGAYFTFCLMALNKAKATIS